MVQTQGDYCRNLSVTSVGTGIGDSGARTTKGSAGDMAVEIGGETLPPLEKLNCKHTIEVSRYAAFASFVIEIKHKIFGPMFWSPRTVAGASESHCAS